MQGIGIGVVVKGIQRCLVWTYKDLKGILPKLA
jgi:hypothetical protein